MHVVLPRLQCDDMFLSCVLIVAAVAVSSEREAKKKQHFHIVIRHHRGGYPSL